MRIVSSGKTDVGMKRRGNEDSFTCDDELGLYVVADGMGGHAAGEVASRTAVETILKEIRTRRSEEKEAKSAPPDPSATDPGPEKDLHVFEYSVQLANRSIVELSGENPIYNGMGTTVSGMLVTEDVASITHVGDSRIYMLREGAFSALTTDHSWVNEQLQRNIITPEEARNHRWRNVITRALGNKLELEVDTANHRLVKGDRYLLCSDGLSSMVDDDDIHHILEESADPEEAARRLVEKANENGGTDNITTIVLQVED